MGSLLSGIRLGLCCLYMGGWVRHIWVGGKGRAAVLCDLFYRASCDIASHIGLARYFMIGSPFPWALRDKSLVYLEGTVISPLT